MKWFNTDDLKNDEIELCLSHISEADMQKHWLPAYYFDIYTNGQKIGSCDLRIGDNQRIFYGGNIGYQIDEAYRGHHYAKKACLLLFQLAQKHQLDHLYITCAKDNIPSNKTCQALNGQFLGNFSLPKDSDLYQRGERDVNVYLFRL